MRPPTYRRPMPTYRIDYYPSGTLACIVKALSRACAAKLFAERAGYNGAIQHGDDSSIDWSFETSSGGFNIAPDFTCSEIESK